MARPAPERNSSSRRDKRVLSDFVFLLKKSRRLRGFFLCYNQVFFDKTKISKDKIIKVENTKMILF